MNPSTQPLSGLTPREEVARLEKIAALGLLAEVAHPALQLAVDTISEEMDLPIALVSVVLDEVQYFAAMGGLEGWMKEARGTPIEWSFCLNAVRTKKPFVVTDALSDPRVKDSPLVQIDQIRSYAGVPLLSNNGLALGAFCVIGAAPRDFSTQEIERLEEFGRRIVAELEKSAASKDGKN